MNGKLKTAINKVYNELLALSSDEFAEMLSRHEDGDIAKIILETGALDVGKIETDGFALQAEDTYYTFQTFNAPAICDYLNINKPLHNLWYDKIPLSNGSFASNLYELNSDRGVIGWADNLGFLLRAQYCAVGWAITISSMSDNLTSSKSHWDQKN
jgi:hypothetical protein